MALPLALSICDTFLVDEWTDFCGHCLRYLLFARTHIKLQKCVQKPLRWVKIHENQCPVAQMWITTTDRQITDTTDWGQTHSHLTQRPHVSFGIKILVRWFCLHFDMWSCPVCVIFKRVWDRSMSSQNNLTKSRHVSNINLENFGSILPWPTCVPPMYLMYLLPRPSRQVLKYCTVNICTARLPSSYITK